MENYKIILNNHDLKATPQRLAILEIIEKMGHISVEELYEKVKGKYASLSLATIYKNINAMLEKTVLAEVKLPNKKNVYEIVKHDHSHLLCSRCGEVIDVSIENVNIENEIAKRYNFDIEETSIVISGVCQNCR